MSPLLPLNNSLVANFPDPAQFALAEMNWLRYNVHFTKKIFKYVSRRLNVIYLSKQREKRGSERMRKIDGKTEADRLRFGG